VGSVTIRPMPTRSMPTTSMPETVEQPVAETVAEPIPTPRPQAANSQKTTSRSAAD
jgi:hypothetical protein